MQDQKFEGWFFAELSFLFFFKCPAETALSLSTRQQEAEKVTKYETSDFCFNFFKSLKAYCWKINKHEK